MGSVTVYGLLAREDHERLTKFLLDFRQRASQSEARRQRVGAGEKAIGQQNGPISPESERLAQRVFGHRRTHGENGHLAAETVAPAHRLFKRKKIIGIDDRRHTLTHDRVRNRMNTDLSAIRNLLHADDDVHRISLSPLSLHSDRRRQHSLAQLLCQ